MMNLVQHHTKYKEIHGVDETIWMEKGAHIAIVLRHFNGFKLPTGDIL